MRGSAATSRAVSPTVSDRLAMVLGGAEALSGRLWLEASTRAAAQPRRSSMLGRGHERVRGALACLRRVARVCGPQYVAIHLRDPKFREAHEFRKLVRTNIETKVFEKTKHFENRWQVTAAARPPGYSIPFHLKPY